MDLPDDPQDFRPELSRAIDYAESMMQRAAEGELPTVAAASEVVRDALIGWIP